ncbi:MAG: SMP-30/gluconolactonase/LRE family protein [Chroococcidiopsidaceae cyanobacterium CP_BM_RX_35]|nr:SMP-30/gluconolactonase/LRE family protein [Chroococcidiopsidaceae cyanobacterium CP_BM_RX_35]
MGKITAIICICAAVLLLVYSRSVKLNTTFTLPQQAMLSSDGAVAAISPQIALPSAYLITPMSVVQSDNYSEGVVVDRQGNIYFSEIKPGTITVLAPDGTRRLWAQIPGANGHGITPDGTHIVAAQNSVVQLDANGKNLKVIAKEFQGQPLVYPNDITIDPQGGFYFTDSGDTSPQNPTGKVYYVNPAGKLTLSASKIAYSNGTLLTPDRKHLFVSESGRNRILVYDVRSQGMLGPQQVFAELPMKQEGQTDNQPDGLAQDATGNLYVAHYGMRQVQVLDPHGKLLRSYASGNLTTSDCAFGGPNLDRLFVVGGLEAEGAKGGIFRLDLGVPGQDIRPRQ